MNTLDLVKQNKVMLAIVMKAEEAGFDVLEATSSCVTVKANCLPVKVTWEMCSCHGGRMWFSQENTNIYIELSSEEYDKDNGVVNPETELSYYIDNKIVETIKGFEKYVYVVDVIGEYTDNKIATSYFDSVEKASRFVFNEDGHDLNNEYGEVIHQYPNPDRQSRVTYVGENNGVLLFKGEHIRNGTTYREYEIKFMVYKRNK